MSFKVVIPARLSSTRLPRKVLLPLAGRPLIAHVHDRALESGAEDVWIATDSEEILSQAQSFGAQAMLTAATHTSGSDRLAELAQNQAWADDDIVVNLQGDEPLMPGALIAQVAQALIDQPQADIATACTAITDAEEFYNYNAVKVVRDTCGYGLYFSRAPIPHWRDGGVGHLPAVGAWRHLGIYAYRVAALKRFSTSPPSPLETTESLEQLRALSLGMRVFVVEAAQLPGPGVDTQADFDHVAAILENR